MEQKLRQGQIERRAKVEAIVKNLDKADSLVFNDYRGLTVQQITEIRRELRKKGAQMHVHKNCFIKIAMRQKEYPEDVQPYFTGPTAITYIEGDAPPVLKTFFDFIKKEYPIKVRGAFVDNVIFDEKQSEKLAKLPSKEELIAQLMRTMNAPVQNLALSLNDVITRFARVLQAVANKKE